MAKKKDETPAADDITEVGDETPPALPTPDHRDQEIAALKAMLAERDATVAAMKAASPPVYAEGKKYKVTLQDAGTAVVQCGPGEHPWDAFRRLAGVVSSVHTPSITEAPDDAECGHLSADGTLRPFAA